MNQAKVFIALKLRVKKQKIKEQKLKLLHKVHEQEQLNEKLEGLLKDEVEVAQ